MMTDKLHLLSDDQSGEILGRMQAISSEIGGEGTRVLADAMAGKESVKEVPELVSLLDTHMRAIFKTPAFTEVKAIIVRRVVKHFKLPLPVHVQITPSARIVIPGAHATSFHTDYWYGHGKSVFTIWTPLTAVEEGNAVGFVKEPDFLNKVEAKILDPNGFDQSMIDRFCAKHAWRGICKAGDSIAFSAETVHGSPANTAEKVRVSFDFRIFHGQDGIGSKDWDNYEIFDGEAIAPNRSAFAGKRYMKYTCGGRGISNRSQHQLIREYCMAMGIDLVTQESELEHFGFLVLKNCLTGLAAERNIDGIVLFGKQLLDEEMLAFVQNHSQIEVIFCAENAHVMGKE